MGEFSQRGHPRWPGTHPRAHGRRPGPGRRDRGGHGRRPAVVDPVLSRGAWLFLSFFRGTPCWSSSSSRTRFWPCSPVLDRDPLRAHGLAREHERSGRPRSPSRSWARPRRGGLHGRDRPWSRRGRRPRPVGVHQGPRNDAVQTLRRSYSAGHEAHHPARRQPDHPHAEDDVPSERPGPGGLLYSAQRSTPGTPDHATAHRRQPSVPSSWPRCSPSGNDTSRTPSEALAEANGPVESAAATSAAGGPARPRLQRKERLMTEAVMKARGGPQVLLSRGGAPWRRHGGHAR